MITGLKPYPSYKNSAVPWLGKVPDHWDVRRGKNFLRCIDLRSPDGTEELLTVSSKRGVLPRRSANVTMFKAESYAGYKLCWPGDLVINSLWAWARGLGVSGFHGIVSSAYGVYRLRPEFKNYSAFLHELVRSEPFNWELQVRSKGIWTSRLQLTDESFLEAPFPFPPREELPAIIRYLVHVDKRIQQYISIKLRLMKVLEEQKQAVVHRVLTHGLDSNQRRKTTGNQWFPEIPGQWEVLTMRRLIRSAIDGPHFSPNYVDEGIPFLSGRNIKPDGWSLGDAKYISEDDYTEFCKRVVPLPGDVLYTKGGTTGVARVVDLDFRFQVWVHVAVLKVIKSKVVPEFLAMALNSPRCYEQSQLFTRGATNQDLGLNRMKEIVLPVPPICDQIEILKYIPKATAQLAKAVDRSRNQIDLLRQFRTRLVADVVTGKLDVRAAVKALPDGGEESDHFDKTDSLGDNDDESVVGDAETVSKDDEA